MSNSERAHRRLNAFVHIYKDKLQLKDPGQELSSEAIPVDLSTINYDKFEEVKGRAKTGIIIKDLVQPIKPTIFKRSLGCCLEETSLSNRDERQIRIVKLKKRKNLEMMKKRANAFTSV